LIKFSGGAQIQATPFYRAQCTISAVECFDPYKNTWSDCPPLSETRAEAGAVVIWSQNCEQGDFVGNNWTFIL